MRDAPLIILFGLSAVTALASAVILSKRWMRYVALGCAAVDIVATIVLAL
jgi:hypothetical protein